MHTISKRVYCHFFDNTPFIFYSNFIFEYYYSVSSESVSSTFSGSSFVASVAKLARTEEEENVDEDGEESENSDTADVDIQNEDAVEWSE